MELGRAVHQISEIHGYLARAEVYRGLRPGPVALTGALAALAAALQPWVVGSAVGLAYVHYWVAVAAIGVVVCGADVLRSYCFREDRIARRRTLRVLGQFLPCLAAGAAVTLAFAYLGRGETALLPGLWSVTFALGIFAARPYLPRAIGWVALFYLVAGFGLLLLAPLAALPRWGMGLVFGLGQLGVAFVLHENVAREADA
jgi:hypothetical protein